MDGPSVSVCIPTYNAEKTIKSTLSSILAQTYNNFNIYIFDNASTDNTIQNIESIGSNRIIIHRNKTTTEAESNFTRCLQNGIGKYTAIYHADDLYDPEIVVKQINILEKDVNVAGILTFATLIDESDNPIKTYYAPKLLDMDAEQNRHFDVTTIFKAILANGNFLFCPSAMIRTDVCMNHIKTWRGELFKSSADLDVWLRLAKYSSLALINQPLLKYRISTAQWTHNYAKFRTSRAHLFLVLDYWKEKEEIKTTLTDRDEKNYQRLLYYDDLQRIWTAIKIDDYEKAQNIYSSSGRLIDIIKPNTIRDLKLVAFTIILTCMFLPIIRIGVKFIFTRISKNRSYHD